MIEPIMSHRIKTAVVILAIVALTILGSAQMPAPGGRELDIGDAISLSALLAPRVTIAPSALRELRDRMARFDYIDEVSGLFVCVLTPQEDVVLSVELCRDALRVYEIDA